MNSPPRKMQRICMTEALRVLTKISLPAYENVKYDLFSFVELRNFC